MGQVLPCLRTCRSWTCLASSCGWQLAVCWWAWWLATSRRGCDRVLAHWDCMACAGAVSFNTLQPRASVTPYSKPALVPACIGRLSYIAQSCLADLGMCACHAMCWHSLLPCWTTDITPHCCIDACVCRHNASPPAARCCVGPSGAACPRTLRSLCHLEAPTSRSLWPMRTSTHRVSSHVLCTGCMEQPL